MVASGWIREEARPDFIAIGDDESDAKKRLGGERRAAAQVGRRKPRAFGNKEPNGLLITDAVMRIRHAGRGWASLDTVRTKKSASQTHYKVDQVGSL